MPSLGLPVQSAVMPPFRGLPCFLGFLFPLGLRSLWNLPPVYFPRKNFEYQLVHAVCVSALLYELIFQLHKAM